MTVTKEDVAASIAKIGYLPPDVIELYVERKTKWKECLAASEEIIAREPEHCAALIYIGNIYQERGQPIKALRYFDRVTAITPLFYPAWQGKGMCELRLKRLRAAQFSFGRLMETAPNHPFPFCGIALVFFLKGSKDLAVTFLDDIVARGKVENPEILIHLRAMFEERMGLTEEALMHYIESQMMSKEKDPDTAFKIHTLAGARGESDQ